MKKSVFFLVPVLLLGCGGGSSNKDTTKPVIILQGAASVSLEAGTIYTDSGATASDNVDGTITSQIVTVNSVDTDTVGTYEITYNVTDAAGNAATTVTRSVEVVEPVLTGFFTDSAVQGLTYTTATQSGVTDALGTFSYVEGENISFTIGAFVLGDTVAAKAEMTPLDLTAPALSLPTTNGELDLINGEVYGAARPFGEGVNFAKFRNLLVLLQSLDSDKDASNGITISSGMAALFEGVELDFESNPEIFRTAFAFRKVMAAAVAADLIDTGLIKSPSYSLGHYYEAQGISTSFTIRSERSTDSNGDGSANNVSTFTYDANGNQLTESYDSDADGSANVIYTFTYDASGNRLIQSLDSDADGNANLSDTYTYDANGNRLTQSVDGDADGSPNSIYTYTYDANGNLLSVSRDSNADGSANTVSTYTYDANGNLLSVSRDSNADGSANSIYTSTYDAIGSMLISSSDDNADGIANYISTYTYDANGVELSLSSDTDGDGSANEIYTYTYDANGIVLSVSSDTDADGSPNSIYTYTYDANANQRTESTDDNADGIANYISTYTYDANGNELSVSFDNDADGSADSIETYTNVETKISAFEQGE